MKIFDNFDWRMLIPFSEQYNDAKGNQLGYIMLLWNFIYLLPLLFFNTIKEFTINILSTTDFNLSNNFIIAFSLISPWIIVTFLIVLSYFLFYFNKFETAVMIIRGKNFVENKHFFSGNHILSFFMFALLFFTYAFFGVSTTIVLFIYLFSFIVYEKMLFLQYTLLTQKIDDFKFYPFISFNNILSIILIIYFLFMGIMSLMFFGNFIVTGDFSFIKQVGK